MDVIAKATDIQAVWMFAGDWKHWVAELRRMEQNCSADPKDVWLQIGSLAEATDALESRLVDVLVVQGQSSTIGSYVGRMRSVQTESGPLTDV